MGSLGDVAGDAESFALTTFKDGRRRTWTMKANAHSGSDHPKVRDWVQVAGQQIPALSSYPIAASVESHLMAFATESSRALRTIEHMRS